MGGGVFVAQEKPPFPPFSQKAPPRRLRQRHHPAASDLPRDSGGRGGLDGPCGRATVTVKPISPRRPPRLLALSGVRTPRRRSACLAMAPLNR